MAKKFDKQEWSPEQIDALMSCAIAGSAKYHPEPVPERVDLLLGNESWELYGYDMRSAAHRTALERKMGEREIQYHIEDEYLVIDAIPVLSIDELKAQIESMRSMPESSPMNDYTGRAMRDKRRARYITEAEQRLAAMQARETEAGT